MKRRLRDDHVRSGNRTTADFESDEVLVCSAKAKCLPGDNCTGLHARMRTCSRASNISPDGFVSPSPVLAALARLGEPCAGLLRVDQCLNTARNTGRTDGLGTDGVGQPPA